MGGLFGGQAPSAGYSQAAVDAYGNAKVPDISSQLLNLQNFQNVGDLQLGQENAIATNPSAMQNIQVDPRLQQAQMAALGQLSQLGQMGMTPGQAAALQEAQRNAAASTQAKSAQIQDEMARRGMGGSGAELAARLQASQGGAEMANQNSNAIMQMAQQNALNAIGQSGALAGQVSGQQFGQQSDIAKAQDYINQFNTQNQQAVQQRNVASQNTAAQQNLANRQNLSNQNVAQANQQQQYNKQLQQQQFQNQMAVAGGKAGVYQNAGQQANQAAANKGNMMGNIIGTAGTVAGAYLGGPLGAKLGHEAGTEFADYEE